MADLPPKQPGPGETPSTLDHLTVERTLKFLYESRRFNKFKECAQLKKLAVLEAEIAQTRSQIRSFSMRFDREFDKHPDVFRKLGLSRDGSED